MMLHHKLCIESVADDYIDTLTDTGLQFVKGAAVTKSGTGVFDVGSTSGASPIHEMFDIIDNIALDNSPNFSCTLYVQPSDKSRTNQLAQLKTDIDFGNSPKTMK